MTTCKQCGNPISRTASDAYYCAYGEDVYCGGLYCNRVQKKHFEPRRLPPDLQEAIDSGNRNYRFTRYPFDLG